MATIAVVINSNPVIVLLLSSGGSLSLMLGLGM